MSRTALRIGGVLGIAHVVLAMAGFALLISGDALMDSPAEGLTAYFVDGPMAQILAGGYIELLGFLCFLPFAAALVGLLRTTDNFAAPTALAAAVAYVTLTLSPGQAAGGAAVYLGHHGTTDVDLLRGLVALRTFSYFTSLMALGLFFAAVAVAALTARTQPRWVGVSAATLAVALLAGVAVNQPNIPPLLGFVWVVAVSVRMLRTPDRAHEPAAHAVAAD